MLNSKYEYNPPSKFSRKYLVYLICDNCAIEFTRSQSYHHYATECENAKHHFCSKKCRNDFGAKIIPCKNCGIPIKKQKSETKRTNNSFCSQSCAAKYNNTHKTKGTRRSKLEIYIENELSKLFPDLIILYNNKSVINSELDIYIPSAKLAFELNGIFHYEPIYGDNKLNSIQLNDKNKFQLCLESNISLCVVDVSDLKYFKSENARKYLDIITNILLNHQSEISDSN